MLHDHCKRREQNPLFILTQVAAQWVLEDMDTLEQFLANHGVLLRAEQVARLLSLHVKTVYDLTRKGKLPVYNIGGALRYDGSQLAVWLNARFTKCIYHP